MNIVIIEDEQLSSQSLERLIKKLRPSFKINMIIKSIETAVIYFNKNKNTDLIFCDIELIDGPSFNIFSQVEIITPIIFITAFNNYAKEALKTNVIGYLTKPFFEEELETVLQKFEKLQQKEQPIFSMKENSIKKDIKLLIHVKGDLLPVSLVDIALFCFEESNIYLFTFQGEKLSVNKTMQYLEELQPNIFYKANRQFLINRNAIANVKRINNRRLQVKLNILYTTEIYISKEKTSNFIKWLSIK